MATPHNTGMTTTTKGPLLSLQAIATPDSIAESVRLRPGINHAGRAASSGVNASASAQTRAIAANESFDVAAICARTTPLIRASATAMSLMVTSNTVRPGMHVRASIHNGGI